MSNVTNERRVLEALHELITTEHESKEAFIARVGAVILRAAESPTDMHLVMAYRYGDIADYHFPVGVFTTEDLAKEAAAAHRRFRGGKYQHKIFRIEPGKSYDAEQCPVELQLPKHGLQSSVEQADVAPTHDYIAVVGSKAAKLRLPRGMSAADWTATTSEVLAAAYKSKRRESATVQFHQLYPDQQYAGVYWTEELYSILGSTFRILVQPHNTPEDVNACIRYLTNNRDVEGIRTVVPKTWIEL